MRHPDLHHGLSALALAGALGLVPLVAAPAGAAAEGCDGRAATLVVPAGHTGTFTGTSGDDVIVGTSGDDTIDGGAGDDTICGLAGADDLLGGAGDDRLFGGLDGDYSPDDDYHGDRLVPGPGDDHVDLGHDPQATDIAGVDAGYWDQVSFSGAPGPVSVDLRAGTATGEGSDTIAAITYAAGIDGSPHDDTLVGTDGPDWITGSAGDDVIRTLGGPDRVEPDVDSTRPYRPYPVQPGDDTVDTGDGNDHVLAGHGADVVVLGAGRDHAMLEDATGGSVSGDAGRDDLVLQGSGRLAGGPGADMLRAWYVLNGRIDVDGGAGSDTYVPDVERAATGRRSVLSIDLRVGSVELRNGAGGLSRPFGTLRSTEDQQLELFTTAADVRGTAGPDLVDASDQETRLRVWGRGGADRVFGGSAADVLRGGAGRDTLGGGLGRDRCLGGETLRSCEIRR